MKANLNNTLDDFLSDEQDQAFNEKVKNDKVKFINQSQGLIERVDKIYLVEDGRQLLREQY